ncbi:LysM peptidoglycan-binding domain-containing protein [Weissella viridescens]|uniref:LysM peptidoglycan-binding domain-containing protein n=1 Tax=Weissella viridescens TaxID=1629 RepID=UPI001D0673FF|nr:LysM peptidoglycan-binding domain-containing protein [Weissella viridescens]MCB6839782.1 LysM peptidoglycan-binding domain-containing protein [Weissella viridescens]MCB6846514.1 LysM peptidoglycan-binding domain-containing protein [Weissella viridescens]
MSNTTKNAALAVAGLASVFAAGQTVANAATYTVQKGDTLSEIASKFNLTVEDLVSTNKIADKNLVFTDQKIEVAKASDADKANDADAEKAAQKAALEAKQAAQEQAAQKAAAEAAAQKAAEANNEEAKPAAEVKSTTQETEQPAAVEAVKPVAKPAATSGSGSTYDEFIANGGTDAMWQTIVQPESGGNPNAVSPNGYTGLGQTKESWGTGSVADQTKGMVGYATSRYGSVESAVSFRQANGWW